MLGTIMIVDDNENFAMTLDRLLAQEGYHTLVARDGGEARKTFSREYPDVVLIDIRLPDVDGVELMEELTVQNPDCHFIMMTAYGSIRSAIRSMRVGALDYLTKPFDEDELLTMLHAAMNRSAINEEVSLLRSKAPDLSTSWETGSPDYPSPAMRQTLELARNVAQGKGNLLITGESGVGKNYLARWIHRISPRNKGPFFDISCTALTPSLVESELFGHEPGAFTGSKGRKRGLVELADTGTLFLDEIGDMDPVLQAKLLAFLDTHSIRRIGGEKTIKVDARVIAATNRELESLVESGAFRRDLYYRLNVLAIRIPPLRERKEDLPFLVQEICAGLAREMGLRMPPECSPSALDNIFDHDWPGNIRELKNVLERALILSPDKSAIDKVYLRQTAAKSASESDAKGGGFRVEFPQSGLRLKETLGHVTRALIEEALARSRTKNQAAALLGISRFSLAHHMRSLGMKDQDQED